MATIRMDGWEGDWGDRNRMNYDVLLFFSFLLAMLCYLRLATLMRLDEMILFIWKYR